MSRGGASVTFVDRDPQSLEAIRRNLVSAGLTEAERDGSATVIRADVDSWVATAVSRFDLILCDPPYTYGGWDILVRQLPGDLVVLESGSDIPPVEGWGVVKSKRYGGTIVTVARPDPVSQKGAS
jgi:16S rRNA G966 N2-methylase RsmD